MRAPFEPATALRSDVDVADDGPSRFWRRANYGLIGAFLALVAGTFTAYGTEAWPLLVIPVPMLVLLLHFAASVKLLSWAHGSPTREVLVALVIITGAMVLLSGLGVMMDGQYGSAT
ncbi:hypothetical protein APB26_32895 [Pseudomonas aeruginosa]|nr:hypothetical protein APB26_32895 [Pseudomonas aeruginosa]RPV61453.1 hypothetical protein IPC838_19240 [Pseudomonas aeruginosa]